MTGDRDHHGHQFGKDCSDGAAPSATTAPQCWQQLADRLRDRLKTPKFPRIASSSSQFNFALSRRRNLIDNSLVCQGKVAYRITEVTDRLGVALKRVCYPSPVSPAYSQSPISPPPFSCHPGPLSQMDGRSGCPLPVMEVDQPVGRTFFLLCACNNC